MGPTVVPALDLPASSPVACFRMLCLPALLPPASGPAHSGVFLQPLSLFYLSPAYLSLPHESLLVPAEEARLPWYPLLMLRVPGSVCLGPACLPESGSPAPSRACMLVKAAEYVGGCTEGSLRLGPVSSNLSGWCQCQHACWGIEEDTEAAPHPQLSDSKDAFKKTWNPKFTLRSHYDGIRSLAFHHSQSALLTASEDGTLKLWNLQKAVTAKK